MTRRGPVEAKVSFRGVKRKGENHMRFFTVADVAESLRVSTRTVRRWIDAGKLVAHRINGVLRIADNDLRAFLGEHRDGTYCQ